MLKMIFLRYSHIVLAIYLLSGKCRLSEHIQVGKQSQLNVPEAEFKVNNRSTRKKYEICSKLTI